MDESLQKVLADVAAERAAQERAWGVQDFPDGTGPAFTEHADRSKRDCADAAASGEPTWRHILTEEFYEALAESDPALLRKELVQTAAVAVQWIQALDRRHGGGVPAEKLVRDRIPEIITGSGRNPRTRIAGQGEYTSLLRAKLLEEVTEYTDDADPTSSPTSWRSCTPSPPSTASLPATWNAAARPRPPNAAASPAESSSASRRPDRFPAHLRSPPLPHRTGRPTTRHPRHNAEGRYG
ncbi:nucleoside triphosphate pyrophosphohydrolase [Spirillospora sp. NPDC052242]